MVKERQSNIELLRVVCMFFIVLEHMLLVGTDFFSAPVGHQLLVANSILGFTYVGANCFILITGYFGADFSWKRLLSLYLTCAFYELIGFTIAYSHGDVAWSTTALSYIIFPLSHSDVWFVRCYVVLLFLLPLLNAGLNSLDKKGHLYVLLLLTILNLYFGWFHKQQNFNGDGYNSSQMVYLYVIGRYLKRYMAWEKIKTYRKYLLIVYLLLAIMWGAFQNINIHVHAIPHWNGWAYNNPIVMISSIVFFAYFRLLDIPQSQTINLFGATMFGVFLIHVNRYGGYIYDGVRNIIYRPVISDALWMQVGTLIILAIGGLVIMSVCDMTRLAIHNRLLSWLLHTHTHTHTHTHKARISLDYERYRLFPIYT